MQNVLISIVTAFLSTLLIEFTARPLLEARKERIVAGRRGVREFRTAILPQLRQKLHRARLDHHFPSDQLNSATVEYLVAKSQEAYEAALRVEAGLPEAFRKNVVAALESASIYCEIVAAQGYQAESKLDAWEISDTIKQYLDGAEAWVVKAESLVNDVPQWWRPRRRRARLVAEHEATPLPPVGNYIR